MWEQIRSNQRRSFVLIIAMALLLVALGAGIGAYAGSYVMISESGEQEMIGGGLIGVAVATMVWLVMSLVAYYGGGSILLSGVGARRIEKNDHPRLFNIVEEMTLASGLPKMPDIYIIDDPALNAFATGRDPQHAAVAITRGLLGRLNRDELQGVIAHEIAHVTHRDILFMTMVSVMMGSIVMIAEVFTRSLRFTGGSGARRSRYDGKGGGQMQLILLILVVALAILAPIAARIIYLAASRRREYLADAGAAVFTRYPAGLASALEAISSDATPPANVSRAVVPMFIHNPLQGTGALNLFSTHPPMEERIRILRAMSGSASFQEYQAAWQRASGAKSGRLPGSALASPEQPAIRAAQADDAESTPQERLREAGDILRRAGGFVFLPCTCGLRVKLPPNFKGDTIACPRCARVLSVPVAEQASTSGAAAPLVARHNGKAWRSVKCTCGAAIALSPALQADHVRCTACGSEIRIVREGVNA